MAELSISARVGDSPFGHRPGW